MKGFKRFGIYMAAIATVSFFPSLVGTELTVWEQAKKAQHSVEGTIQTVAEDEQSDRLLVRVKTAEGLKTLRSATAAFTALFNNSS